MICVIELIKDCRDAKIIVIHILFINSMRINQPNIATSCPYVTAQIWFEINLSSLLLDVFGKRNAVSPFLYFDTVF